MLIWYFIQRKDFASAFQQVKALDKRNREDGQRVFQFAQSAFDEGNYDAALTAYQYIISEKERQHALPACPFKRVNHRETKITIAHTYSAEELTQLERKYESYFI